MLAKLLTKSTISFMPPL